MCFSPIFSNKQKPKTFLLKYYCKINIFVFLVDICFRLNYLFHIFFNHLYELSFGCFLFLVLLLGVHRNKRVRTFNEIPNNIVNKLPTILK